MDHPTSGPDYFCGTIQSKEDLAKAFKEGVSPSEYTSWLIARAIDNHILEEIMRVAKMTKYVLKYNPPTNRNLVHQTQPFDTADEAEEYYRLYLKPWGFGRVDVVAIEEETDEEFQTTDDGLVRS